MGFFRSFFSYEPSPPWPDVPKYEPPDPNAGHSLPDSLRVARRNLVGVCGLCLAWSTAQVTLAESPAQVAGVSVSLSNASVPLLLGALLVYLAIRWGIEFAMMPRTLRRWPMAQLDFGVVLGLARLSLLTLSAGALGRSLWAVILRLSVSLVLLVVTSGLLTFVLMLGTMPIRLRARAKVGRVSAASAAIEAVYWAGLFAVSLTVLGFAVLGVCSYQCESLRRLAWNSTPNPAALIVFVVLLVLGFLSHWLLRPVVDALFAVRPDYYTERRPDGSRVICCRTQKRPPLL